MGTMRFYFYQMIYLLFNKLKRLILHYIRYDLNKVSFYKCNSYYKLFHSKIVIRCLKFYSFEVFYIFVLEKNFQNYFKTTLRKNQIKMVHFALI
jgi:hypothetical protein